MSRDVKQDNALLGPPHTVARRRCSGVRGADRRLLGAQGFFHSAASRPNIDFSEFPICKTSSDATAAHRRATKN